MSKFKYSVGDKVRVKDGLKIRYYGRLFYNEQMVGRGGSIITIEHQLDVEYGINYSCLENNYYWNEEMIETYIEYNFDDYIKNTNKEEYYTEQGLRELRSMISLINKIDKDELFKLSDHLNSGFLGEFFDYVEYVKNNKNNKTNETKGDK